MAYSVPAGGILEIRVKGTLAGQVVMMTFHYRSLTTYEDGAAAALLALADFNAVVWSALFPAISTQVTDVKLDAQWITPTRYRAQQIAADPTAGSNAGSCGATGQAVVVRRFGEEANRHNQGRIYIFGPPTTQTINGRWSDGYVATELVDVRDAIKAVIQTGLTEQLIPVLVDKLVPGIGTRIIDSQIDPIIRYQRRRELGVGQ